MQARFSGLSRHANELTAERDGIQANLTEAQQLSGNLRAQLEQTQEIAQSAVALQAQTAEQLTDVRREATYMALIQTEYPDLMHVAPHLQRMDTMDAQRAMLDKVRQQMGTQVAAATRQAVEQNYAGATPGAGPAAGGGAPDGPTRDEIMAMVMDSSLMRSSPEEYAKWWRLYEQHPSMNHSSLGAQFQDPFGNDYQAMQRQAGQTPAALNQRHPTQAFEEAGPGQPTAGMPEAWGGSAPPRPGGDPFRG
jgi:hypothetical protein